MLERNSFLPKSTLVASTPKHALEIGVLLPNNERQHLTLHIQKDVMLYALC
jgi:hypothetical protein